LSFFLSFFETRGKMKACSLFPSLTPKLSLDFVFSLFAFVEMSFAAARASSRKAAVAPRSAPGLRGMLVERKGGGLCEGLTRKTLPGATICESDAGRGISVARESAAALSLFAPYPRALLRASPILEIRERVLFAERCESIVHRNVLSRFVLVAKGDLF
jgi:hypothetical protein